jgi:hypothetical protein
MPDWTSIRWAVLPFVIGVIGGCSAGSVTQPGARELAWLAPTTNADGTPLLDLAGYKLHYDAIGRGNDSSYRYANVVDIGMPSCSAVAGGATECQYQPASLVGPAGTKIYLTLTAYDHAVPPNQSAYSNEISLTQ